MKTIFECWPLAELQEIIRQTEAFDPWGYGDREEAEMERPFELRRTAAE